MISSDRVDRNVARMQRIREPNHNAFHSIGVHMSESPVPSLANGAYIRKDRLMYFILSNGTINSLAIPNGAELDISELLETIEKVYDHELELLAYYYVDKHVIEADVDGENFVFFSQPCLISPVFFTQGDIIDDCFTKVNEEEFSLFVDEGWNDIPGTRVIRLYLSGLQLDEDEDENARDLYLPFMPQDVHLQTEVSE